jgi:hypothetical protein
MRNYDRKQERWLETGEMDTPIDYFCQVARARAAAIQEKGKATINE